MQKAKRLISLFLVFAMLAAYVPAVYAEENPEEPAELTTEVVEAVQETEQPVEEATEAEETPEAEETEEITEEVPEETEEAEVPEEVSEEEPAEEAEEETEEETEEEEQPALSAEELAKKALLAENGVVETLAQMTEGVDYTAGVVLRITDSKEDAIAAAEAYHGELLSYVADVAEIGLTDLTVLEAVTLAADPDSGLPAVSPDYLAKAASRNLSDTTEAGLNSMANLAPRRLDWYSVVQEIFDDPDPLISDPGAYYYQWQHDVLHTYTAWGVTPGVEDPNLMKIAIISDGVQNLDGELLALNTARGNELLGLGESFDDHVEGTAAAHIMAANFNNGTMGAGVLPHVGLISYNVVREDGVYNTANIAKAIRDAINVGAKVIYIDRIFKFYVPSYDDALRNAVAKGVTVVAPLGDYGTNIKTYPAASEGVVGVAGTTRAGTRVSLSNYGKYADLSAPGDEIPVSINGEVLYWSGSCPAAAMVAGAAAMYLTAKGIYLNPSDVLQGLKKGTNKAAESGLGAGILDLEKMLDSGTAAPKIKVVDVNDRTIAASALSEDGSTEGGDASVMEDSGFVGGIGIGGTADAPAMPTNPNVGNGEAAVKIPAKKVSSEDFLVIEKESSNYNDTIIITFDGSTPAVLNGEIVNGYRFSGKLPLSIFGTGKVVIKAMVISAAGKLSKVASIKLDILPESVPEEVDILAPKEMIAGGTVTLTAKITPDTAKQEVVWSIVSRGSCTSACIDSRTGELTTSSYQTGTITVRAAAAANPRNVYKDVEINIKKGVQVGSVVLNETNLNMLVYGDNDKYNSIVQLVPTFLDVYGRQIQEEVDCKFISSNPKVVYVSEDGWAIAVSKGTATITCTALDGSNKKATCKMTVKDGADTVKITGQASIAPGASATYKLETNPKVKLPVRWFLTDAEGEAGAPNGVSISSTGKVTVDSRVRLGTEFRVCYESNDSQYIYSGSMLVTVCNKTTAVKIQYDSDLTKPNEFVINKNGSLKSVTIFSTAALEGLNSDGIYVNSNVILLYSEFVGQNISKSYYRETWTSSNPAVATVDPLSGLVVGLKAGTTKITCKANDGSNKSASVTVKVVTPASSVTVVGPTGIDTVNYGKSVTNKAVLGDAYGKPSVKGVNWKVVLVTEKVYNNAGEYLGDYDHTQEAVRRRYVTVSSSGKLTVKKTAENLKLYSNSYLEVTVGAEAKDGGYAYGVKTYEIRPAAKSLYTYDKTLTMYTRSNIDSDPVIIYVDGVNGCTKDMQIKSSNPEIAGGEVICANGRGYVFIYTGEDAGTAKLTITTADQAKKSVSITVKVELPSE